MSDPVLDALQAPATGKTATAAPASSGDPVLDALQSSPKVQPIRRTPIAVTESPSQASLPAKIVSGALDVGGGLLETVGSSVLGFGGALAGGAASYAGRFLPGGDWDRAQRWADEVQKQVSTVGGLYGDTETTTGKAIEEKMHWLGGKIEAAASAAGQKTLEATGSPTLASTVDATVRALPQIAGAKLLQRAGGASSAETAPTSALPEGAAALAPDSITKAPAAVGQGVVGGMSKPELALAIKQAAPTVEAPAVPMAEAADHAPQGLPQSAQADRVEVLARVGHQNARISAVTGDGPGTMFDFDSAKSPDAAGQKMRSQIDSETATNAAFADKIQQATGGSAGVDQTALYNRGSAIDAARAGLQQWHENQVTAQYASARQALGDTPVTLSELSKVAPDPARVSGTTQGIAFKAQLDRVMQSLGITDKEGNVMPTSVNNAENLRKWMNASWSPETNGFIVELKNALDSDVTSAAGKDVFEQAREARTLQAQQLGDTAFDRMTALGASRNLEAIPDVVARLPSDQLAHVANVFSNMPEGLQPLGTQALNEIASHFANRINEAGTPKAVGGSWSNIGVSKYIANNNARLSQVFTPKGLQMISDLNQAGKITAMDKRYIGAAAQGSNFAQRGLITALPRAGAMGGAALGAMFGHPGVGAAGGALGGETIASRMQAALAAKQMAGRIQRLNQATK